MSPRTWTNPRTGESLELPIEDHSGDDVREISERSYRAWLNYRNASMRDRARVLVTVADALDSRATEVVAIADDESALGEQRLVGEVARTVFQLKMFAGALEQGALFPTEIDLAREGSPPFGRPELVRNVVPLGPVAVFGASNFPFAFGVLGGDFASALAAGCTVVVKEHSAHPRLSMALVEVARTALSANSADPDLVLSVRGTEAGATLVQQPHIAAVGFTGSVSGGRHLFDLAQSRERPIPFYGELGSVNPVVISRKAADARADQIAQGFVDSLLLGAGQFCTKPSILIYPEGSSIINRAQEALVKVEPVALLTTRIATAYRDRVKEMTRSTATNLLGAEPVSRGGSWVRPALFHASAAEMLRAETDLREECFGPAAVAVAYSSDDEALALSSIGGGVLVACVHGEDDDSLAHDIIRTLVPRAGRIAWNAWPTGVAVAPVQMHGGPYPAATVPGATSVGLHAAQRFVRPIVFQSMPENMRVF